MANFLSYVDRALDNLSSYGWEGETKKFLLEFSEKKGTASIFIADLIFLRTESFKLQSFGRVLRYSKQADISEAALKIRDLAKEIEDSIGQFLYSYEMHELILEKRETTVLSRSVSKMKQASNAFSSSSFRFQENLLGIHDLVIFLKHEDVKLRDIYIRCLLIELKKIHKKIKKEIDPVLLENGTHKLRRLLRWVIMHIIYPRGLFSYDSQPKGKMSSFLQLSPYSSYDPVSLPYHSMRSLSDFVAQLGEVKDEGLYLYHLHQLAGQKVDINQSEEKTVFLTKKIKTEVIDKKIIKRIRKPLKESLSKR